MPQCRLQQTCLNNNISYQANIIPIGKNSETNVYFGIAKHHLNYDTQITRNPSTTETASQVLSYLMSFGK